MRHRSVRTTSTTLVASSLVLLVACAPGAGADDVSGGGHRSSDPPGQLVVVELFTSQGCSSCPPADRLLSQLAADPELGDRILPLSFHVDYWNYIGWTDPFSSAAWSTRQRDYANAFDSRRVYTPQMVIDGRWETVGSNEREVRRLLDRALAERKPAAISLGVEDAGAERLRVRVTVSRPPAGIAMDETELAVALFESGLDTSVPRGENRGRELHNDVVVRTLKIADPDEGSVELPIDPDWNRERLGIAAFLQAKDSREMLGAAARRDLR